MVKKEKTAEYKLAEELIKNGGLKSLTDVQGSIDTLYSNMLQILLNEEINSHLGYEKSSHKDKDVSNRRNGHSSKAKKVRTKNGVIQIDMPRDRDGTFEPEILKKRQKVLEGMDDIVISMYAKGNTLEDISELIEKMYKIKLSKQTLSNMTDSISEETQKWQKRPLKKIYSVVYVDCIYCYVKRDFIGEKTAVYVAIGIDIDGFKEVLGLYIDKTESATFWQSIFEDIKSRGTRDILFVCMDGLKGLPEAITKVFPKTITQKCIVHIVRNIYDIINKKEAKNIIADFKKIYTAPNLELAKLEYKNFTEKYKDNIKLMKKVSGIIDDIFGLFDFPKEIRKLIYTTNAIESVNAGLRKVTRGRGSFIHDNALLKVLYLRIRDLENKWSKGTANWNTIQNQLIELFSNRVLKYIT